MSREDLYVVPDQDEVEEEQVEPYKASLRETIEAILMGVSLGITMAYGIIRTFTEVGWWKLGGIALIVLSIVVLIREVRPVLTGSNDEQVRGQGDGSRH
jgi:hypothetical protein